MLRKIFYYLIFIIPTFVFSNEFEVSILEESDKLKLLIGNTSQDPILVESRLVITDCSFIGNLCLKAMDDKGNELNILYFSPNFDTTFKDRYWLKPNKIFGLYILKEDLSLMLSLKKKSKITLQFLYHNKSNDRVFKSIPIKVNLP